MASAEDNAFWIASTNEIIYSLEYPMSRVIVTWLLVCFRLYLKISLFPTLKNISD